ncbi:DUF1772 domain-containing protein [Sphaerisporangium aureirubrum]|uniref:DUF1772 domain-containing protein n=1 Tax=Sphaerisporangium aureirubrum TaxID=1544736 RepID=A0ABW1N9T1_9ACTN
MDLTERPDPGRASSGPESIVTRTTPAPPARVRAGVTGLFQGFALLTTGLLAGTFAYGAVNIVPAFNAVPLEVRLTFHSAMMRLNEPVMRTAMALAIISSLGLALASRGLPRLLPAGAAVLGLGSLLITLLGNVPLHQDIKRWAATGSAPPGHQEILRQWDTFHAMRTATGLAAFLLIIVAAVVLHRPHHDA